MPSKTSRLCPRCRTIVKGPCPNCSGWSANPSRNWKPGTYSKARWQRFRKAYLRANPMCQWPGCADLATVVDHLDGIDYETQRYDWNSVRGLCKPHHDQRTTRQSVEARRERRGG